MRVYPPSSCEEEQTLRCLSNFVQRFKSSLARPSTRPHLPTTSLNDSWSTRLQRLQTDQPFIGIVRDEGKQGFKLGTAVVQDMILRQPIDHIATADGQTTAL